MAGVLLLLLMLLLPTTASGHNHQLQHGHRHQRHRHCRGTSRRFKDEGAMRQESRNGSEQVPLEEYL